MPTAAVNTSLFQSAQEVFSSMLGLPLTLVSQAEAPEKSGSQVMAGVGLVGQFCGTVVIECSGEMACQLAQALLGAGFDEVDEDVKDMVGEIANMVAGGVSKGLPGPPALTPPCVAAGTDFSMGFLKTEEVAKEVMECEGRFLTVSLLRTPLRLDPAE